MIFTIYLYQQYVYVAIHTSGYYAINKIYFKIM